ncbi:MAG TPA: STAS domain-containing protein [Dongiaceae bacterium]|nr:STAS domain-containing protein [Dongiaceae bacterium]
MLRVEMRDSINAFIFRLEGRFTGEEAEHIRTLVTRCHSDMRLVVDLTEVTFVDAVGEDVLSLLKKLGALFLAGTSYALDICERLHLPLARKRNRSTPTSHVPLVQT